MKTVETGTEEGCWARWRMFLHEKHLSGYFSINRTNSLSEQLKYETRIHTLTELRMSSQGQSITALGALIIASFACAESSPALIET
jgi:hypothetical protein